MPWFLPAGKREGGALQFSDSRLHLDVFSGHVSLFTQFVLVSVVQDDDLADSEGVTSEGISQILTCTHTFIVILTINIIVIIASI